MVLYIVFVDKDRWNILFTFVNQKQTDIQTVRGSKRFQNCDIRILWKLLYNDWKTMLADSTIMLCWRYLISGKIAKIILQIFQPVNNKFISRYKNIFEMSRCVSTKFYITLSAFDRWHYHLERVKNTRQITMSI